MNFFSPCQEENRSKLLFIGSSLNSVDWEYTSAVHVTSGSAGETSVAELCALGQEDSGRHRRSGSLSHRLSFTRASAESPRDASSAGFCEESTCLHCEAAATSCIVATRFATKVWKRLLSFWRYPKTQVLLVQNTDSSTCLSFSVLMIMSSLGLQANYRSLPKFVPEG